MSSHFLRSELRKLTWQRSKRQNAAKTSYKYFIPGISTSLLIFIHSLVSEVGFSCHIKPLSQLCRSIVRDRQSLWIYMTIIVENMQTVCEGLRVICEIATGDDFDNLAIICSVLTFC